METLSRRLLSLVAGVFLSLAIAPAGAIGELSAPVDQVAHLEAPGSGHGSHHELANLEIEIEPEETERTELDSGLAYEQLLWVIHADQAHALAPPNTAPSYEPVDFVASHAPRGPPPV